MRDLDLRYLDLRYLNLLYSCAQGRRVPKTAAPHLCLSPVTRPNRFRQR